MACHAINRSFEIQIFPDLHGLLRGNPYVEPECECPQPRRHSRAGFFWPSVQRKTDNQESALYVNHVIGMALGTIELMR
jgi:hypothetical protein